MRTPFSFPSFTVSSNFYQLLGINFNNEGPIRHQDFHPRIHITDSDFASITQDGALCDTKGQLGPDEFANVIRRQVRIAC